MGFKAFGDASSSVGIGGMTVENDAGRVSLYGSLDLTESRAGLADARRLREVAEAAVSHLERIGEARLPAEAPPARAAGTEANPFG